MTSSIRPLPPSGPAAAAAPRPPAHEKDSPATFAEFLAKGAEDAPAPAERPEKPEHAPKGAAQKGADAADPAVPHAGPPGARPAKTGSDETASDPAADGSPGFGADIVPTLWVQAPDAAPRTDPAGGGVPGAATCEPGPCLAAAAATAVPNPISSPLPRPEGKRHASARDAHEPRELKPAFPRAHPIAPRGTASPSPRPGPDVPSPSTDQAGLPTDDVVSADAVRNQRLDDTRVLDGTSPPLASDVRAEATPTAAAQIAASGSAAPPGVPAPRKIGPVNRPHAAESRERTEVDGTISPEAQKGAAERIQAEAVIAGSATNAAEKGSEDAGLAVTERREAAVEPLKAASPELSRATSDSSSIILQQNLGRVVDRARADAVVDLATPARFERVLEQLRGEIHKGKDEFRLSLDPPELGRLDVSITAKGDGVVLRLFAERGDVAQWLRTDLPILHKSIEKDGLHVLGVEVGSWLDHHSRARDGHTKQTPFSDEPARLSHPNMKRAAHIGAPLSSKAPLSTSRIDFFV